ncbi:MAG: 2,3,4,5-tetrahydropyridine-2,6-carboxylate N-succinyltransferase [Cereibacter sphaeroides]|uniref:2,3,4,5-tetrahydropyridine-2,6-carboxylate N-succinyltransferase n=1 Tax=Cereibacter sphaeroides TaxID=1063 RepID=A0A2W5SFX5_CERSP|nr:MAG: 2,3,4,5-tetrahydropyridine-2,6-carboxylate N-succinyltransferase [Cereibacter sphaeroides]
MATGAELTYTSASALQMANAIFGNGVTVTGASYSGPAASAAIYSKGATLSSGVVPSDTGVILSTGNARDFTQSSGDPNRSTGTTTDTTGTNNNAAFNAVAGTNTYDAVWLNADFVPQGDVMTIRFVFSSEEYPEYIGSQFNDVIGVWVNGSSVPISVGTGQTGVNSINSQTQPNLFVSNTTDAYNTEMDGFTITLTLKMHVNKGVVNSIRIGIADVSDAQYDSNLLIAADSVQTVLVARDETLTIYEDQTRTFDVLGNDVHLPNTTLTITQINGVNVVAGQTVTLPSGQKVQLNADGTITLIGDGTSEKVGFTYTVKDNLGNVDTGLVTLNAIPCFVAGTRISTPAGLVAVEDLRPGDMVLTQDDGPRPVRWIGRRRVQAAGEFAPIHIRAGTFGQHGHLAVSPQHRILIRDSLAELLFGEEEVLVAARDLVNGRSVIRREGGIVEYVHLLFDRHQVVFSEGLATESFLPGPQAGHSFPGETLAEICTLFPELDPATGQGYSPAVRRTLRGYEARVLLTARAA